MATRRLFSPQHTSYGDTGTTRGVRQASYSEIQNMYTSYNGDTSKSVNDLKHKQRYVELRDVDYSNSSKYQSSNMGAKTKSLDFLKLENADNEVEELMRSATDIDIIIDNWMKLSGGQTVTDSQSSHEQWRNVDNRVILDNESSELSKINEQSRCVDIKTYSDNESSVLSTKDNKSQYSEKLKEFENMVLTCNDQGEYVYLSQVNGGPDCEYSTVNKHRNTCKPPEAGANGSRRERTDGVGDSPRVAKHDTEIIGDSTVLSGYNVNLNGGVGTVVQDKNRFNGDGRDPNVGVSNTGGEIKRVKDIFDNVSRVDTCRNTPMEHGKDQLNGEFVKLDQVDACGNTSTPIVHGKDGTIKRTVDGMDVEDEEDAEENLKKIVQECLWYFHSQVETYRSHNSPAIYGGHVKSQSQPQSPRSSKQIENFRFRDNPISDGDITSQSQPQSPRSSKQIENFRFRDNPIFGEDIKSQSQPQSPRSTKQIENFRFRDNPISDGDITSQSQPQSPRSSKQIENFRFRDNPLSGGDVKSQSQPQSPRSTKQIENFRFRDNSISGVDIKSQSQPESPRSNIQINRRYHPNSNVVTGHRPRSMTDGLGLRGSKRPHRPRSVTEIEMLQVDRIENISSRNGRDDLLKQGDGVSLVPDVSSVSSRHGSQQQSRVHTLPPRIPSYRTTPPVRRYHQRESSSSLVRRRQHLEKRSKSNVDMSVSTGDTYDNHVHGQQQDHVSAGRMFIEDVLNDIHSPRGLDNCGSCTQHGGTATDGYERDIDNNEIKSVTRNTTSVITNGLDDRVTDVTGDAGNRGTHALGLNKSESVPPSDTRRKAFAAPLYRSKSEFHVNSRYHSDENAAKHLNKGLNHDVKSPRPLPNLTKDSKFIRSLSQGKLTSELKQLHDDYHSKGPSRQTSQSSNSHSESSSSDLGVFDIVGEDSGCRYPWQRDAFTQYEPSPNGRHVGVRSSNRTENNTSDASERTHQGINKSGDSIVRRHKLFRTTRPQSVGSLDTTTLDADLADIAELQNNARARLSEPMVHSPFARLKTTPRLNSDESNSNLEAILETPAEITLKHSAYRNVLASPSVSPEIFRNIPEFEDDEQEVFDEPIRDSPKGKRKKPARHRSSGSITSGSEDSDNNEAISQPLARRGRRAAIVDTKNCGDVSPTTLSPEGSPYNSSDEGDQGSGRSSGRRRSSANNGALNVYPGDLLVQEHHKKLIKRNTIADFYSGRNGSTPNLTDDNKKQRQPFSLLKLMKTRSKESLAQLSDVLQTLKPTEFKDNNLAAYKNIHWTDLIASTDKQGSTGDLRNISAVERKRRESVWELFKSECVFLIDHLMVLKNCFLEPLKKLQVEGFLMYTEPSEIFSNLEDLCYVSYTFCKDFIGSLVKDMSATDFGRTSVLIKALQRFSAHSKDGSVYHTYCLNYSNALTYLEKLRKNDDFCEFEKWCEQDSRCNRLQLADLLIGPMQHCTKLPLLLHNIKKYTEDPLEKRQVTESIDKVERALEQLEDKMKWLKNFERVQEIQRQLVWPSVSELDPRAFIPDNLKSKLLRQPCARLLACPTRQLLHEGAVTLTETTKTTDAYMFLFDDILLVAKMKKRKQKQTPLENSGPPLTDTYTVHRQPLALDRLGIHDLSAQESAAGGMKFAFVIVQISRFQQIIDVFTLQAPTENIKNSWLTKIRNAKSQYHSVSRANSLKGEADSSSASNSTQNKSTSYQAKSRSIDTVFL